MNFVELIGLLISLGAFLFVFFGQALKSQSPAKTNQNKKLQDFLDALKKDMEIDEEEEEELPKAPLKPQKLQIKPQASRPPVQESKPMVIQKPLEVTSLNKKRESLIRSKRDLVLLREVMDHPRAYRPWTIRHF